MLIAAQRACRDYLCALGIAAAVAGTHIGTFFWRDPCYWFDNCAHAFAALALIARGGALPGLLIFLGLFVDERVLCSLPFVALFHWIIGRQRREIISLLAGAALYLGTRFALTLAYGLGNPLAGVAESAVVLTNLTNFPIAFWFALEGGWLVLLQASRRGSNNNVEFVLLWTLTAGALIAAGFAGDFTRSATYVFPATIAGTALLRATHPDVGPLRHHCGIAAAVSLLVPNGIVIWDAITFEASLPVRVAQAVLRAL